MSFGPSLEHGAKPAPAPGSYNYYQIGDIQE